MNPTEHIHCIGCGALVPDVEGPAFRYPNAASPGCWALYQEILTREYSNFHYGAVHHLSVDAYMVQHPGDPTPQTIQSVNVHLMALYLRLEKRLAPNYVMELMGKAANRLGEEFRWLEPPEERGEITVLDVAQAENGTQHQELVQQWASSAWKAWGSHHGRAEHLVQKLLSLDA